MELLLLSTSALHGQDYLAYALAPIEDWLNGSRDLLFVPFALHDHDEYVALVQEALMPLGVTVHGAQRMPTSSLDDFDSIFVGGGNSFRLLRQLQSSGWDMAIADRVRHGSLSYMGSSAGTNMACPTIRTTNDMPIISPKSLEALNLVPFQINPHYLDPVEGLQHMGETRETRLFQFLEENNCPVVGLREGAWLRRSGKRLELLGGTARLFEPGQHVSEHGPGENFDFLLDSHPDFG